MAGTINLPGRTAGPECRIAIAAGAITRCGALAGAWRRAALACRTIHGARRAAGRRAGAGIAVGPARTIGTRSTRTSARLTAGPRSRAIVRITEVTASLCRLIALRPSGAVQIRSAARRWDNDWGAGIRRQLTLSLRCAINLSFCANNAIIRLSACLHVDTINVAAAATARILARLSGSGTAQIALTVGAIAVGPANNRKTPITHSINKRVVSLLTADALIITRTVIRTIRFGRTRTVNVALSRHRASERSGLTIAEGHIRRIAAQAVIRIADIPADAAFSRFRIFTNAFRALIIRARIAVITIGIRPTPALALIRYAHP